jgi:hypothetical protein
MTYKQLAHGWLNHFLIIGLLLLLSGCGNDYAEQIQKNHTLVTQHLHTLGTKLRNKELTNSKIVSIYATKLARIKPDLSPVADAMAKDATDKGMLYQGLVERLQKVNKDPENKQEFQLANQSLASIDMGADPIVFNDALLDLINTMAELSGGELDTISIPKDSQSAHARGENITPGSYLVGNPSYGQYQENSSGQSMWHWYGQYAFFSSLFRGNGYNQNPIRYNDWNTRPRHSYYNDYGRSSYGSSGDRGQTKRRNIRMRDSGLSPAKPKKEYGSAKGRKKVSTYSKQRASQSNYFTKKSRSSKGGGRHADKARSKRSCSFLGSKKSSRSTGSPSKRSSRFFGSSSRSSRSSGGK